MEKDDLPHFQICKCGSHGRIVFHDGRTGGEIMDKDSMDTVLQYTALVHNFQKSDIFPKGTKLNDLFNEIRASTLQQKNNNPYFEKQINTWNTAKLHQPALNPEDFHKVMDRLYNYNAFDH